MGRYAEMMQSRRAYCFAALIFFIGSVLWLVCDFIHLPSEHELLLIASMPFVLLITSGPLGLISAPALCALFGYAVSDMMSAVMTGDEVCSVGAFLVLCGFALPSGFICAHCSADASLRFIGTVRLRRHYDLQPIVKNTLCGLVCSIITFSVYFSGIK